MREILMGPDILCGQVLAAESVEVKELHLKDDFSLLGF
jgi:hypothetical protein